VVEQILVIEGTDVVLASVVFDSVEVAADVYGELHGRNIYDGCYQMHIKWGLPTLAVRGADEKDSVVALTAAPSASVMTAPAASTSVAQASYTTPTSTTATAPSVALAAAVAPVPAATTGVTLVGAPPAAAPASTAPPPDASTPITPCAISIEFVSSDITKRDTDGRNRARVDELLAALEALAERVHEEQSTKEFFCHDSPCDGHDQAPPHRVNLDGRSIMLTIDVAATAASSICTKERVGDLKEVEVDEVPEDVFAVSRQRRASPHQPRPLYVGGKPHSVRLILDSRGEFLRARLVPDVRVELVCVCLGFDVHFCGVLLFARSAYAIHGVALRVHYGVLIGMPWRRQSTTTLPASRPQGVRRNF
jgi:hypothetical protein